MLNDLYRGDLNYFINYFLPSVKLISKERHGSKIKKRYDKPKTPFQRMFESKDINKEKKLELLRIFKKLNPFELQKNIKNKTGQILKLSIK
ncbi:MAG: hypothetical protein IPP52_18610 [Ignavibacteria bacterium]|nr:hypothetical protein [Ignavibacteria bacterium]